MLREWLVADPRFDAMEAVISEANGLGSPEMLYVEGPDVLRIQVERQNTSVCADAQSAIPFAHGKCLGIGWRVGRRYCAPRLLDKVGENGVVCEGVRLSQTHPGQVGDLAHRPRKRRV